MSGESIYQARVELSLGTAGFNAGVDEIEARVKRITEQSASLQNVIGRSSGGADPNVTSVYSGLEPALAALRVQAAALESQKVGLLNANAPALAGSDEARRRLEAAQQSAVTESQLATGPQAKAYAEAKARTAVSLAQENAALQSELAENIAYAEAKATSTIGLAQQKALYETELAGSQAYAEAKATATIGLAQQKALYEAELAGSEAFVTAKVEAATSLATQTALENEELAVNAEYLTALRAAAISTARRAEAEALATGRIASDSTPAKTSGGLLGSGVQGLAQFALGTAAFIGVSAGVRDVLKETSELQKQFSILRVQMQQTDQAGQFKEVSSGLFEISRDTGVATSGLAKLAIQVQGTFQGQGSRGTTDFLLSQVRAAAEINKVFGLSFEEIGNSVQSLAFTFDKSFRDIGDRAAGLQSRFGVTAKEIISSVSQIGPVAKEMGLNFSQLSAISAAAERETGRTGVSVTEALGRVLPNIAQHTQDVLAVYQGNQALAGSYDKIVKDLASGRTGDVLLQLVRDWAKLGQQQKDTLLFSLGGARQAPQLAAVFGDPQLLKELNKPVDDAGKLARQFKSLGGTLGQTLSEVKQDITQLGQALAEAGIVEFLTDFAKAAQALLGVLQPLVDLLRGFSDASGSFTGFNIIGKIVEGAVLLKGLSAFKAARAEGGGLGASSVSALTLGLKTPKSGANEGTLAGEELGAKAAAEQTAAMNDTVEKTSTSFTQSFIAKIKANKLRVGAAGAGIAAAAVGEAVGGQEGGTLSAIGSGLLVGSIAGPEVGVVVAASQIIEQHLQQAKDVQDKVKELVAKYGELAKTNKGQAELGKLVNKTENKSGFQDGLLSGLGLGSPFDTPQQPTAEAKAAKIALVNEGVRRSKNTLNAILGQLNPSSDLAREIKNTIKEDTGKGASEADKNYLAGYTQDLVGKVKAGIVRGVSLGKIIHKGEADFSRALASGDADKISTTGTDLSSSQKAEFESGSISYATYISQLKSDIKGIQDVAAHSKGGTRKQDLATLGKLIAQRDKATSDYIKSQLDFSSELHDITGSNTYSDAEIQQLANTFNNPKFTDPSDRSALLGEVIKQTRAKLQDEVNRLTDNAAKIARAAQGEPLPEPAKLELAREYLDQAIQAVGDFSQRLGQLAASRDTSPAVLENKAIELSNYLGINYSEAFRLILNGMLNRYNKRLKFLRHVQALNIELFNLKDRNITAIINGIKGDVANVQGLLKDLNSSSDILPPDIPNVGLDTSSLEGQASKDDLAKRIALAKAGYQEALSALDPVAAAQAAIQTADITAQYAKDEAEWWDAQAQRVRAEQQLQAAEFEIAKLAATLAGANTADPVKQAQLQLNLAVGALLNSHSQAESLQAQIDIVAAQRQLADLTAQTIESQISLAQAVATAAGDSILAAQDALKNLQVQLAAAVAADAGPIAINNLKTQIVAAQASVRDATLQERESTIDFNLQVQKISTAQAISEYQALLSQADILGLTEAQRRDLILKIQNLKHTLNQDLQFDLPSDLRLPTLYEARRLSQSGGNYQDNRVTTISLSSTDPASTQAAVTQINDAINAPPVYGSGSRIY